jgi:hypothetical protein
MKIAVDRFAKKEGYTIGRMYIDGVYFCDTLEDTVRDLGENGEGKVMHQTAIPAGTYRITLELSPSKKRLLPYLHSVPFFTGILIHRGNDKADTSGCILVGENKVVGKVISSAPYEERLVKKMQAAANIGEHIAITITN